MITKKFILAVVTCSLCLTGVAFASDKKPTSKGDVANGKKVYTKTCQLCHGEKGQGDGPAGKALKARNFSKDKFKWGTKDEELKKTITKGNGVMPPNAISEKEALDVITYIRTFMPKK